MVGRRKLPHSLLNHVFNALSIGVQYTLSFQLTNFGLKCLVQSRAGKVDRMSVYAKTVIRRVL